MSNWWQYYTRSANKRLAFCNVISCKRHKEPYDTGDSFSTQSLRRHMEKEHNELIKKPPKSAPAKRPTTSTIDKFASPSINNNDSTLVETSTKKRKIDESMTVVEQLCKFIYSFCHKYSLVFQINFNLVEKLRQKSTMLYWKC